MTFDSKDGELQELRRTRCAVVFADLVESVRLIGIPEADAVQRWRRFVAQARNQWLPATGGRLVRTDGDALLMEFDSAAAAVAGAFLLHAGIEPFNAGWLPDHLMHLRVGIHVDEVMFDEHEAYGPGVNLAKRVTGLAQPRETVVSAAARNGLADGLHAEVTDLGERYVKHLDEPIRVFRARPVVQPAGPVDESAHALQARRPPADLRPGLAVVPFRSLDGDSRHDGLGCALADDIIAGMSRNPGVRVLARLSTAAFSPLQLDAAPTLESMRQTLGASYVLYGSTVVVGDVVTLRATLCALTSGAVVWSDSGQASIQSLFARQDELVPGIVAQVSQQLHAFELARIRSLPMATLSSYTLYLGATGLMNSLLMSDFERAREALEHLVDRHPRQAAPLAMLAQWHLFRVAQGWFSNRAEEGRKAWGFVNRALDIDADLPQAHVAAAIASDAVDDNVPQTLQHVRQALAVDPAYPHAWVLLCNAQVTDGDAPQGLQSAQHAIALSPLDPRLYLYESYAARAAFACREHGQAVRHARQSVRRNLFHAPSHRMLIGALWEDGLHDEARVAAKQYVSLFPRANAAGTVDREGSTRRAGRFVDALRAAGVPP